ncbi:MAG: DinB family protein [Acidimicrobiia bacterium]
MLTRCDECGFDPVAIVGPGVADELCRIGSRYRAPLTRLLPGEDASLLRKRPQEQVWSAIEYAVHARDVFRLFERRVLAILAEEGAALEIVDHDKAVDQGRYRELVPIEVASEVLVSAEGLASRLRLLSEAEWDRCGAHLTEARSIREIAQRALHEGRHHLLDVGRVLRSARGR